MIELRSWHDFSTKDSSTESASEQWKLTPFYGNYITHAFWCLNWFGIRDVLKAHCCILMDSIAHHSRSLGKKKLIFFLVWWGKFLSRKGSFRVRVIWKFGSLKKLIDNLTSSVVHFSSTDSRNKSNTPYWAVKVIQPHVQIFSPRVHGATIQTERNQNDHVYLKIHLELYIVEVSLTGSVNGFKESSKWKHRKISRSLNRHCQFVWKWKIIIQRFIKKIVMMGKR